uniref:DUF834 domain-containing protein n=1 Tax=Oryza barthii TaxID=65489 RepID=A0A0D3H5D5_9ORYZ
MVEESTWTLYPWEAGIVPGMSIFEVGGEGSHVGSGRSAWHWLAWEVGEVGDDRDPRTCGRGGKAQGRRCHGDQLLVAQISK